MSETAFTRLILTLLLLLCGVLLYLDWIRHHEMEGLHMRLDALSPPQPIRTPPPAAGPAAPAEPAVSADPPPGTFGENLVEDVEAAAPHPLIRSVLAAHTDTELSTLGREGER